MRGSRGLLDLYQLNRLRDLVEDFRRSRKVRCRERDPEPARLTTPMLRSIADHVGVLTIPSGEDDRETEAWVYWMVLAELLQLQAWAIRHGRPTLTGRRDDDEVLADMNEAAADLVRQLVEGDIPEEFSSARDGRRGPSRAPARRRDALHKIGAAARIAGEGSIPGLTSREVLERTGEALGLSWEGVRKAVKRAGRNREVEGTREEVLRRAPEERAAWIAQQVVKATGEYKEWDMFLPILSHSNK